MKGHHSRFPPSSLSLPSMLTNRLKIINGEISRSLSLPHTHTTGSLIGPISCPIKISNRSGLYQVRGGKPIVATKMTRFDLFGGGGGDE